MPWHGKLGETGHCGGFFTAADFLVKGLDALVCLPLGDGWSGWAGWWMYVLS